MAFAKYGVERNIKRGAHVKQIKKGWERATEDLETRFRSDFNDSGEKVEVG